MNTSQNHSLQPAEELGRANAAAGSMNLDQMNSMDNEMAERLGPTAAGALNSRRKAQDRRTTHQSNNPSFASNVDNMAAKAAGQSLLADQMLLHPRDAAGSATCQRSTEALRSKQAAYVGKMYTEQFHQPQEDPQHQMDENVCEDESLVVEQSGHSQVQYEHAAIDSSMDNALFSNNGM